MSSRFNREDGTFALVDYADLTGSGSVGSVVVSIGGLDGIVGVASGIATAGSNVIASVGSGLTYSAGAIIVNVTSGISFSGGALIQQAIAFSAHKNGTSQSVGSTTYSAVSFGTEVYDVGSYFASNAWVPPAGKVSLKAACTATADVNRVAISIFKNGAQFRVGADVKAVGGSRSSLIAVDDIATGTDSYAVRALVDDGGTPGSVSGDSTTTYFMGHWIGS